MNKGLEARIVKLEQVQAANCKALAIRRTSYLVGEVTGFETPRGRVLRQSGESESALFERACSGFVGLVVVGELRGPEAAAER